MDIIGKLDKDELLKLIASYDRYIQDANDEDYFQSGWRPVCIDEFYSNEFQEEG
jgi:hypothetical protein